MSNWNKNTGNKGEEIAANWLVQNNYTIQNRNWRYKHLEVDIIAYKNNVLHFIEVKTRSSHKFGMPEESITKEKMTNLKNAAEEFLYQNPSWKHIQFDVIAITLQNSEVMEIFMIEDVYF